MCDDEKKATRKVKKMETAESDFKKFVDGLHRQPRWQQLSLAITRPSLWLHNADLSFIDTVAIECEQKAQLVNPMLEKGKKEKHEEKTAFAAY